MLIDELDPPYLEIARGSIWHRIQLTRARSTSVRINGLNLPPAALAANRFDTPGFSTAYLADSDLTALYETCFRREAMSCPLDYLVKRSLTSFEVIHRLRLVDLSLLAEGYPVLQSQRYVETQALAAKWHRTGLDGIIYSSAQHPGHLGICLFQSALAHVRRRSAVPLVDSTGSRIHQRVVEASSRAVVPIVPA